MDELVRTVPRLSAVELRRWLRGAEIFAGFDDETLDEAAELCDLYPYAAGSLVFGRGEKADALYIVVEGRIAIGTAEPGAPLIAELVAGDSFGELELFSGRERTESATAGVDSILLRLPRRGESFEEITESRPRLAARMLESCLVATARRIRQANDLVKENSPWVSELRRQAYSDKLTGLNNKIFLEERLAGLLSGGARRLALIMVKPDNFKEINDVHGHEAGDAALRLMAEAFARALGPGGEAARYQGNELAAILPDMDRETARSEARRLASALGALDLGPITGGSGLRLSLSLGIALCPEHGRRAEALLEAARGLPLAGRERGGGAILFPEDV